MINKERLETLIKEGATIYSTRWKEEVDLSQKCEVVKKSFYDGKERLVLIVHEDEEHSPHYMLENLTEDIEGAKWEEEFGRIERTERLVLPTWESVYNDLKDYKDGDFYIIDNDHFSFVYNKCYIIPQLFLYTHNEKYSWNANKENYILACRKCKELFLGEN